MKPQAIASLLAAAAFGVIMATASTASGEINQGGGPQNQFGRCPTEREAACMHHCAPRGSSPEQTARCRAACNYPSDPPADPLDCQWLLRSQTIAPNATALGAVRRP